MEDEKLVKKTTNTVRSRINANKELWDAMAVLTEDARTSGIKKKKKKKIVGQKILKNI